MYKKIKRIAALLILLSAVVAGLAGCKLAQKNTSFVTGSGLSYKDIPGVTKEEIDAIEKIKAERQNLHYGMIPSAETFVLENGNYAGFSTLFCQFLSDLFDIPFVQGIYYWNPLWNGLNSGEIDFTGEISPTPGRKQQFFISDPIAERSIGVFSYGEDRIITAASGLDGLKIGFFEETTTEQSIWKVYPTLRFEEVFIKDIPDAVRMLESREIDAFIADAVVAYTFADYPIAVSNEVLPLASSPVSLTTAKPELEPFISVIDKFLKTGGYEKIRGLYITGSQDYAKYEFNCSLTNEEKTYLENLAAAGKKIPVGYENDNYPICFYNDVDQTFQGIAPDLLEEIRKLSGLKFYEATNKDTMWPVLLEMLRTGEITIVTELLRSEKRKNDFLWSDAYSISNYALLSKIDYPFLKLYEIARASVGMGVSSGYEDMYNQLFPDNANSRFYNSQIDAMAALESGEIDLLMSSTNVLLTMMNYREKTGYKINFLFSSPIEESCFGFNKNEELLCSIFNKAQSFIDIDRIEQNWKSRFFDYSRKIANERLTVFSTSAAILSLLLVILLSLFIKYRSSAEKNKHQMTLLSTIYRSLPDLVYSQDTKGLLTSCNHSFEEYVGQSESEIIGKTKNQTYSWDMQQVYTMMAIDQKVISENKAVKMEDWLQSKDLTKRLFEIIKVPLVNDGEVTGLLGINRDITKFRDAERAAQEASRAKSNFLAKMSHEIRTPMNAIIGMAELALREKDVDDAHKHMVTVKQAGAHLLSIINDILDFSKIEMGKLEIITGDYSFSSLLNDVISIIRMRLIDSQVRFAVNIDNKIPDALIGDETRIRQILLNILNNAVKYTEKGFVTFTACCEIINEDTITLILEVMDSGKGIKKEDLNNLFGEYIQIDRERNKGIEGVGLGLAITWNIVKAMEGDIQVYSEYGTGSNFTITLQQKIRSHETMARVKNPEKENVLIYERREIYANSIISTIGNLGVKCTLVSNNDEFRSKLEESAFTFIFISFRLFEINKDIIEKLAKKAKIVVLSEFGEAIPDKNLRILAMPVYSTTIANVLNGTSDRFNYSDNNENLMKFVAPSAKVLIVDDINTNLKVAEGLMLPYQMKVDLCNSGKEALEAIKEVKYDLVFMDHKMPDMDGVETTMHIRELGNMDLYYLNVPIVILTANAVAGTREMFLNNGFNDFLSKPIDTYQLKVILEKWIPKEKQEAAPESKTEDRETANQKTEENIKIPGLDTNRGIFLSGGREEIYLETLAVFHRDGLKKIDEIKSCLENNDIKLYTIYVHALKSASANIGAEGLSNDAKDLENAGEHGDLNFIETHNGRFIRNLKLLLDKINNTLIMSNKNTKKDIKVDTELLNNQLSALKTALTNLDAGIINDTIENLKKIPLPDDISSVIADIYEKILICEYEDAAALIDSLLPE